MSLKEIFNEMGREVVRLGGALTASDSFAAELTTPYGPVRLMFWGGDVTAIMVAFPDNWRGGWYGFARWKVVFKLSNLIAGGMADSEIIGKFQEWLAKFYLPHITRPILPYGYPTIPEGYASSRVLILSLRHLPLFFVWPDRCRILTSGEAVAWRVADWPDGVEFSDWLQAIKAEAVRLDCSWVVFSSTAVPDSRFKQFGVQDGRGQRAEDT